MGPDTDPADKPSGPSVDNDANPRNDTTPIPDSLQETTVQQEAPKDHDDDGGEMVEAGDEDMVIY